MIERVIENWLIKANERAFQVPFCYILASEGYKVIHLSRHCGMELGKDIIAIAPDGIPCAYQLKGGNISLHKWTHEIFPQVFNLVHLALEHPSIDSDQLHRSYLVTNGKIEEEVSRAIGDANRTWKRQRQGVLNTIVGGEIVAKAQKLKSNFWPDDLVETKLLIEIFLEDGKDVFPKSKLAKLLEATLLNEKVKISPIQMQRRISSAALLTAISLTNFTNEKNYVAEIEAWTMFLAYVFAVVEKHKLTNKYYKSEQNIAIQNIHNSLSNLVEDVKSREFLNGDGGWLDQPFYKVRVTWIMAFLCLWGLWRKSQAQPMTDVDDYIYEFSREKASKLFLWGEAAIPQILTFYWYYKYTDATIQPDLFLKSIIERISQHNKPRSKNPLPNPYYEAKDLLPYMIDAQLSTQLLHDFKMAEKPLNENFASHSYSIEGLFHLFVRRNYKQMAKFLWPDITKISVEAFHPEKIWHFYRWRNEERVATRPFFQPRTKGWSELRVEAAENAGIGIPETLKQDPIFALLFLCVFPHRMNSSLIRWLDTQIRNIPKAF